MKIFFFTIISASLLSFMWFGSVNSAVTLPSTDHPLLFGYYHVDAQYGDFKDEVKDYTNTQIIIEDSFIRRPTISNSDIQKLNDAFSETIALNQKIIYIPVIDPNDWSSSISMVKPYWANIEFIYFADEPSWDKITTEKNINNFKSLVTKAGLSQKRIAINYTPQQIQSGTSYQASNLDIIGFEAYVDPGQQNNQNLVSLLNNQIDQTKKKIGNKKMFIVIQAYDRNGAWKNLNSLQEIQFPPYLKSYNDQNVIGLLMFTYARPGGTKDIPLLKTSHQEIWNAISGKSGTGSSGGGNGNGTFNDPLQPWIPSKTINGWFPQLSPDGRYVAYGFGQSWITDLQTKQEYNFSNQPGTAQCFGGSWIQPDQATFMCEIANPKDTANRYEVTVGQWTAQKTSDNPALVAGNIFVAADGHWASWLAPPFKRIAKDNQTLAKGTAGGALGISQDTLVHACDGNNSTICVWKGNTKTATYTPQTPLQQMSINNDYIVYGGYGPIHGIDPSGNDIDLTATSWRREGLGQVVMVNGSPWVASTTQDPSTSQELVLLRPWGQRQSIVVKGSDSGLSVIYDQNKNEFVMAFNSNKGKLTIGRISADTPRMDLSGGMPDENLPENIPAGGPPFKPIIMPSIPTQGLPGFGQLIELIFTWSLSVLGIVVFVQIFYAGFRWFTAAGNTAQVNEARSRITNAITGAIILLAAWIILYTINPDLVGGVFKLPGVGG